MEDQTPSSSPSTQGEGATPCHEPPWTGWIETTGDALLILEAARRGIIPRVTRRLVDSERKMISSGSVFVFDEDESGIKRWTDGFYWSPSRILGNFLIYRETDKKTNLRGSQRSQAPTSHVPSILVNEGGSSLRNESSTLSRPKNTEAADVDRNRERSLYGSLTNSKKFKSQGMMKKTFSLSIGGVSQHLISYYKVEDVNMGRLRTPSSLPELASLEISPDYLEKTHFRVPPRVEYDAEGIPRYRGEADDPESPKVGGNGLPRENSSSNLNKRLAKRYEPYGDNSSKSQRRARSRTGDNSTSAEGVKGGQSRDGDSPLPSPTTPSLSTGGIVDHNAYPGFHGVHGVQTIPVQATNYYVPGFFSAGHSSQTIPFSSFPLQINGNVTNGSVNGENTAPPPYALVATNGTPTVHLGSVGMMPMSYYPAAVGVWRRASSEDDDEDSQRPGEVGSQELNTSH